MRKISCMSTLFTKYGDEPAGFLSMREAGFDACDYQILAKVTDPLFSLPQGEWERILTTARQNAEAAGIEIYQAHGPWVWPCKNDTPEGLRDWAVFMCRDIEACALLGCPNLVVHPVMPFLNEAGQDAEAFTEINRAFWGELLPVAKEAGVRLLLENMPFGNQPLSRCAPMADFVRSFDDDFFAMCLDTGHAMILGDDMAECISVIGDKLAAFHVHDNNGHSDDHACPYFRNGNWEAFRAALKTVPEEVPLSLECETKNLPAHLRPDFLRGFAAVARYLAD